VVLFDTGVRRAREQVARRMETLWGEQQRLFARLRLDAVELFTDQDYVRPLVTFFKRREARLAR
jgi:hypothetical protein